MLEKDKLALFDSNQADAAIIAQLASNAEEAAAVLTYHVGH